METTTIEHYKATYNDLLTRLEANTSELRKWKEKGDEIVNKGDLIQKALDALTPLMKDLPEGKETELTIVQPSIHWKVDTFEFLRKGLKPFYTSPEIFDSIYPNASSLSKEERRKKLINLSVALNDLVSKGLVISSDNEEGRGKIYWLADKAKIPA